MQALKDEPITVYGEGRQTRSFCYVDDLSEGSVRLTASPEVTGPISLGNPCEFTIKELDELIIAITGSKSKLISPPQDDLKQRRPDITLANRHLGWKPLVPLREGCSIPLRILRRY
jgi:UDP-glucuronate decarboxylase